jgi:hypothetical protein
MTGRLWGYDIACWCRPTPAPKDTDHDGIPDAWELANGLNPNEMADGNRVAADGYTMLEVYINSLE